MIKIKKIHDERLIEWQWSGKLLEEVEKFDQKTKKSMNFGGRVWNCQGNNI